MKVIATYRGDESVRIAGGRLECEFDDCILQDEPQIRSEIRNAFGQLAALLLPACCVFFSDECPDCLNQIGNPHKPQCPSQIEVNCCGGRPNIVA